MSCYDTHVVAGKSWAAARRACFYSIAFWRIIHDVC